MPLSYEVDEGKNLLVMRGEQRLSYEDVIANRQRMVSDPRVKVGMIMLVDLRRLDTFEMVGRDVFSLAQAREDYPFFSSEGRTAFVVKDETAFAMARMYMLSRRKHTEPMAIFYSVEEACAWLGIEPPFAQE